jgi:hypothetical protein
MLGIGLTYAPVLRMQMGEAATGLADSEPQKGEELLTSEGLKA